MTNTKKAILAAQFEIPTYMVPWDAMDRFRATIKDADGEDVNFQFFAHGSDDLTRFARGDIPLLKECFPNIDIEDQRSANPMKTPITFTGALRPNQQKVADKVINGEGFGTISAPPRFGKTVVMTHVTCNLGLKTLFLSHQIDLSKQALKTFYNLTDITDLEYEAGRQLIGIVHKWDDLAKYDVCFMPYQKFAVGKGAPEALAEYKNEFGLIWIDEAHRSNARRYSQIVGSFNPKYRHGVSATIEIKSKRHVVNNFVLGPIIAKGVADQVPCQVRLVNTGIHIPMRANSDKLFFGKMLNFLASHKDRNDLIVSWIAAYAERQHFCIAVADRVNMLNYIAEKLRHRGIAAKSFHSKAFPRKNQREQLLDECRRGEVTVLIALRSMVVGLDIPRLTAFFSLTPSANQPNYYQELSRVRTPFTEGSYEKKIAYVVDFVDIHPVAKACLSNRRKVYLKERFEVIERF
jgi:superfamily II DNA or RNA helicase